MWEPLLDPVMYDFVTLPELIVGILVASQQKRPQERWWVLPVLELQRGFPFAPQTLLGIFEKLAELLVREIVFRHDVSRDVLEEVGAQEKKVTTLTGGVPSQAMLGGHVTFHEPSEF